MSFLPPRRFSSPLSRKHSFLDSFSPPPSPSPCLPLLHYDSNDVSSPLNNPLGLKPQVRTQQIRQQGRKKEERKSNGTKSRGIPNGLCFFPRPIPLFFRLLAWAESGEWEAETFPKNFPGSFFLFLFFEKNFLFVSNLERKGKLFLIVSERTN